MIEVGSSRKIMMRVLLILLCFLAGCSGGCVEKRHLADFTSDGCSLFPDRNLISNVDWCTCCFQHDIAYWKGGTAEEREVADLALKACVLSTTKDEKLADTVYAGVRLGGSPYFYNWYRWGYGWDYGRGYAPLTKEEQQNVDNKLAAYYQGRDKPLCK